MISAEELVQVIVRPHQEVCSRMGDKLRNGDDCESPLRPFILHRNQWICLVEAYSEVLRHIKLKLVSLIAPFLKSLNDLLLENLKMAEESLEEFVAPHVRVYFTSSTGAYTAVWKGPQLHEETRMDLRMWMEKHALKHILECDVLHRHMDILRNASLVINPLDLTEIMKVFSTRYFVKDSRSKGYGKDKEEARAFFTHNEMAEIDIEISELLLHRLGENIRDQNPDAAALDRLTVDPAQFQKWESGQASIAEGDYGNIELRKWISADHHVAVKKGNVTNPHPLHSFSSAKTTEQSHANFTYTRTDRSHRDVSACNTDTNAHRGLLACKMISAEELVELMVRPHQEVCSRMGDKLRNGDDCESPLGPFILHRNQWICLVEAYSEVLRHIKLKLVSLIAPFLKSLNDPLLENLKMAEESLEEFVAPHVRVYFTSSTGAYTVVWKGPHLHEERRMDLRFLLLRSLFGDVEEQRRRMDLRMWMRKHALKHILECDVLHRQMDILRNASLVINPLDLKEIMKVFSTRYFVEDSGSKGYGMDKEEARTFFSHNEMAKIDTKISQLLLQRLGEDIRDQNPDAAALDRLTVDPAQFQKCESGQASIGEGGHGKVESRKWISDDLHVAVKNGNVTDQEIRIQARLRHPNVLTLLCRTRHDSESFGLVMERMGSDLNQLIRDASQCSAGPRSSPPFTTGVSVEIMWQIAKGMKYLHHHHIMHRDLKPANILVSGDPRKQPPQKLRVKIADFGLSMQNLDSSIPINDLKRGSGFYRAPEVMDEESNAGYSSKADVYSFGMVCYCILSGKEPFEGDSRAPSILWKGILKDELRPEFDFACEDALKDMVEACWHDDASKRPHFARIVDILRCMKLRIQRGMMPNDIDKHSKFLPKDPRMSFEMNSLELIVRLQKKCSQMQAQLRVGDGDGPFILHRQQWNGLVQLYSKVLHKMDIEIPMISGGLLKAILDPLHEVERVVEAAHKSFQECFAPHVPGYVDVEKPDLRLWMVKDAFRHILDCEVPHCHMDNLRTTSVAVHQALLLVHSNNVIDAAVDLTRDLQSISTPHFRREVYAEDKQEARAFFSKQEIAKIDIHISKLLLDRLQEDIRDKRVDVAAVVERLVVDRAEFQKSAAVQGHWSVKSRAWISNDHHVAVKKGFFHSEEILIQATLRHPNVLPLLCCAGERRDIGERPQLVMEQMDTDLDKLIRDAWPRSPPFTTRVSVEIMLQIAKGMEYLHSHHIMHRDLKPANILVSYYDPRQQWQHLLKVKIADFGVSRKNFRPFDRYNTFKVGTGFYRAPEIMMMEESGAGYCRKVDVYSFAMVCYSILSGKDPFEGDPRPLGVLWEEIIEGNLRPEFDFECEDALRKWWRRAGITIHPEGQSLPKSRTFCVT